MKRLRTIAANTSGITMVEVLLAVGILTVVIVALLRLFVFCSTQAQLAGDITLANAAAEGKLEEIRNNGFSTIMTNYSSGGTPGNIFTLSQLTGTGVVYLDDDINNDSTPDNIIQVDVVVCWKGRDGRVYGEDKNLNGTLDTGEDTNGNGRIDSLIHLSTYISKR